MNTVDDASIDNTSAYAQALYVLSVACFPLLAAGALTFVVFVSGALQQDDGIGHITKYAYFDYPVNGDLVADQFETSGRIESIPAGEVVYLIERVKERFWPKIRIGSEPTSFQRKQHTSSGEGYKYTIELLSVNAAAEAQIIHWFDQGKRTGQYPAMESLDGTSVLARIRVVHK